MSAPGPYERELDAIRRARRVLTLRYGLTVAEIDALPVQTAALLLLFAGMDEQ